jgi:predicted membrane-bound spermidine synthase
MIRVYFGVGLTTLTTLLLELLLTRIFSVTLYYHFAFMVISLALFGLGLSGVMLYLHRERYPEEKLPELLAAHCRRFAFTIVISLGFIVSHSVSTSMEVTKANEFSWTHVLELTYLYLFGALPFYYGGMVVSLALFHLRDRVTTVYFFDLAGAALACLLLDPLLRWLGGPNAVLSVAVVAAATAVLFGRDIVSWRPEPRSLALAVGLIAFIPINQHYKMIEIGSFKSVQRDHLVFSKWNALSRIEVQEPPGGQPTLTIDSMARTNIHSIQDRDDSSRYKLVSGLVHSIRNKGRALIIGPGGGVDVITALRGGHRDLTLVEINPIIINDVMLKRYRDYSGNLYGQPGVKTYIAEGRSFIRQSNQHYDVILATLVDTWAATAAGAFSLSENHLYTVEAFEDYLGHLTPDGILAMSRWVHAPGKEFLRLGSVSRAALERLKVREPRRHVFAASAGWLGTLLTKRTPFSDSELIALEEACKQRGMTIRYSPRGSYRTEEAQVLGPGDPSALLARLPEDVRPVYDDRPFFFYSVKPEQALASALHIDSKALGSLAARILFALLGIVFALVVAGIVVPLWLGGRSALGGKTGSKLRDLSFFVALGAGYILLEIGLLSRFSLYLGHPTHALRVVLFSLLLFSGLGSLLSGRVSAPAWVSRIPYVAGGGVILLTLAYRGLLGPLLDGTLHWSFICRVSLSVILVALPGLLMGMMLPSGIRLVSGRHPEIIPWGWGLNGAASVFGSVLAMVLAVHLGFNAALLAGGGCYVLALAANRANRPAA